jgi:hypothetical protein
MVPICSEVCKRNRREIRAKVVVMPCRWCGKDVTVRGRKLYWVTSGNAYCGEECKKAYCRKVSSDTMSRTNITLAPISSARMTARNPMRNPVWREKAKTTLRAMGWRPPIQGGNGKPPPWPQLLLASVLGWEMELVVPCRMGKGNGYPTCYKLDMGNRELMVGVEVDGFSHSADSRRGQDEKKGEFLSGLGWTVLRFSNRQVTDHFQECVEIVLSTISKSKDCITTSLETY